ncbi:ABC transporter substrate-binding protein [Anaerobium acetethylicum]|uniref:Multiple sugar transport system substrate-binding protein n=1 Tax=Anaerobium acetethylicum TaxID=1619234 RepID=A0A1D3TX91_9FIRM|nr:sugar ABC transporter substrate-binding protein [Anaerobium acetethylicum]SCP98920.1 multiple sugar transport system substrate-binding protein [Anaerobium acetethylicum]
MKKRMKRVVALLLAGVMMFSMTACESKTEDLSSTVQSDKNIGKTELRVLNWGSTEEERIANDAIARFNEANPDVEVKQTCVPVDSWSNFIQKWITMSTSGEAPDVINLGLEATQMAVSNDLLMPLDDIVSIDEDLSGLKDEYASALLDGFSVDGKLYGLPSGTQTMVMYYNKVMFDEAGLAYPKDGWTWDEFLSDAKALTKADGSVYGFGLSSSYFQLTPWWSTNGTALVTTDSKPALNSPEMVEAVEFLDSMVKDKVTPDPISSDVYTMFASKQLAMVGAGRWVLNTWKDAGLTNDDFDCVQWPVNAKEGSVYGGSAWCIGKNTENKELSVELLKAMVSEETLKATAEGGQQVPPTESLATNEEIMGTTPDNVMGIWKAVTIASPIAAPTFFGDLEQSTLRCMEEVFSGEKEPQQALDTAQSEVEAQAK